MPDLQHSRTQRISLLAMFFQLEICYVARALGFTSPAGLETRCRRRGASPTICPVGASRSHLPEQRVRRPPAEARKKQHTTHTHTHHDKHKWEILKSIISLN